MPNHATNNVLKFQYEPRGRISAADGMKHPYFDSFGPNIHKLPDTASIFKLPGITLTRTTSHWKSNNSSSTVSQASGVQISGSNRHDQSTDVKSIHNRYYQPLQLWDLQQSQEQRHWSKTISSASCRNDDRNDTNPCGAIPIKSDDFLVVNID